MLQFILLQSLVIYFCELFYNSNKPLQISGNQDHVKEIDNCLKQQNPI